MDKQQIEVLENFLARPVMFIIFVNRNTIVAFIHGFESGCNNRVFTSEIKEYLESEHSIFEGSLGWPHQILLYSKKKNIEWTEAFLQVANIVMDAIKK